MNFQTLIDSIMRQTTVLIAQLATAQGVRAPLSHVANQVFIDLSNELQRQGVSRKVSADMFGMALRSYLRKIQRLNEGATERGRSLWEAVLAFLEAAEGRVVHRADVLAHFSLDEPASVRSVLHDLSDSELIFRIGTGDATCYRVASGSEVEQLRTSSPGHDELIWALIFREGPLSLASLRERVNDPGLSATLERLLAAGRIERDAEGHYASQHFHVPREAAVGWEGAVLDHFAALVKTITARLHSPPSNPQLVGGSTYSFEVWPGHPEEQAALGLLARMRAEVSELRQRIRAYNQNHRPPGSSFEVTVYMGQCVIAGEGDRGATGKSESADRCTPRGEDDPHTKNECRGKQR